MHCPEAMSPDYTNEVLNYPELLSYNQAMCADRMVAINNYLLEAAALKLLPVS
jgi:hypothetical protein